MMRGRHWSVLLFILLLARPAWADLTDQVVVPGTNGRLVMKGERVNHNGVRIQTYSVGQGPAVVIFNEWVSWRHQIAALARTHRVIAYDLRGVGLSDKPARPEDYNTPNMVAEARAVFDHYKVAKAIVVGQDRGGMTAWSFAMAHPERVERIVIVDALHPRALIRELATNAEQATVSDYVRAMHEDPSILETTRARANTPPNPPQPVAYRDAETLKMTQELVLEGRKFGPISSGEAGLYWYRMNYPKFPYSVESPGWGSRGGDFPMVKAPAIVFHGLPGGRLKSGGLNDIFKWNEKDTTVVAMPGVGHWGMEEAAEFVTARILAWLSQPTLPVKPTATQ